MMREATKSRLAPLLVRAMLSVAALASVGGPSLAAGTVRDNPFLPDTTAEEDKRIAERNSVAQTIRELMPEIRTDVRKSVQEEQRAQMEQLRQQLATQQSALASFPRTMAAAQPTGPRNAPATSTAGMKFYACVNGKTLFKTESGAVVGIKIADGEPSPCT